MEASLSLVGTVPPLRLAPCFLRSVQDTTEGGRRGTAYGSAPASPRRPSLRPWLDPRRVHVFRLEGPGSRRNCPPPTQRMDHPQPPSSGSQASVRAAPPPSSRPPRRPRLGQPRGAQQDSCGLSACAGVSGASTQNHQNAGGEQRSRFVLCGRRGARAGSPPADPPDVGLRIGPARRGHVFCVDSAESRGHAPSSSTPISGLDGGRKKWHSACSVAASYKPPMLVTRVRLPACACFLPVADHPFLAGGARLQMQLPTVNTMHGPVLAPAPCSQPEERRRHHTVGAPGGLCLVCHEPSRVQGSGAGYQDNCPASPPDVLTTSCLDRQQLRSWNQKSSGAWFRSTDLWVMSPTR